MKATRSDGEVVYDLTIEEKSGMIPLYRLGKNFAVVQKTEVTINFTYRGSYIEGEFTLNTGSTTFEGCRLYHYVNGHSKGFCERRKSNGRL